MRLVALLMVLSLSGCATMCFLGCNDVERPDTYVCLANVRSLTQECYNLKTDYDSAGNLNKDAKPVMRTYASAADMLAALDKNFGTDPAGWARLKAYLRKLRSRVE